MIGLLTRLLLCAVLGIAFFRQAESAAAKRPKLDLTGRNYFKAVYVHNLIRLVVVVDIAVVVVFLFFSFF